MRLFPTLSRALTKPAAPSLPAGYRLYAIGDIHGRLDLLEGLLELLAADDAARSPASTLYVFLGDLIDRGPSSAEVVERLRCFAPERAEAVFLLGNHEEVLLRLLQGETALLPGWLKFGGAECARSYGLDPKRLARQAPETAIAAIKAAVPQAHVEFLQSFGDTFRFGDYLFVHAGIRPGVDLALQRQTDLRWIRGPFLEDERDHGFVVVHGHTISETVEERRNRVGIDTGAYRTGVLTALGIEGPQRWFLSTQQS